MTETKCKCNHPKDDHYRDNAGNYFCIVQFCHCKNFTLKEDVKPAELNK